MAVPLYTPVVFVIFKRPETTRRVFEAIRQAKPAQLFIVADGPRADRPEEAEQCAAARAVVEQVDWPCELIKDYSTVNLGCPKRLPTGLDWVFSQVEEAIILEDDCVPHPTFFQFCQELLERYRSDTRVFSISGQNVQFGRHSTPYSYYFSRYNHCWGWATWKRAWRYYDADMHLWPEVRDRKILNNLLENRREVNYWTEIFQNSYDKELNTWDMQWVFTGWIQHGLSILSSQNMVSNIGFGHDGTHTFEIDEFSNISASPARFPLQHPPHMIRHTIADNFTQRTLYDPDLKRRIDRKLQRTLQKWIKP